jgi:hypothetical protein
MMTTLTNLLSGFTLLLVAVGCNNPSNAAAGEASASTPNVSQAASASSAATKVTRIVFVGKEHACDCTRKTVDAGWAALQKALGTPAKLPVEKLQIDTEGAKVEPYRKQKAIMALPAIYFLDGKDVVLDLLQGEVTAEQIVGVLQAKTSAP